MGLLDKPQFWMNHYSVRMPPPGVFREPKDGRKLPIAVKERTEADFKAELQRPKSPTEMMMLRIPDLPPVFVRMQRVGQTAFIGHWLRPVGAQFSVEAFTLCLGGLDNAEDEQAIEMAAEKIIGGHETVRAYVNQMMEGLRKEPRPTGAHIHFDEASYDNQALRVCSSCLAVAFFDQFGAEK